MPTPIESISGAFNNCIERKCSREQLLDFLSREKQRWANNTEVISLLDNLENQI